MANENISVNLIKSYCLHNGSLCAIQLLCVIILTAFLGNKYRW